MATKTWKIGEYAKGGVITTETTNSKVVVIAKDWDFSQGSNKGSSQVNAKEWSRLEMSINDAYVERKLEEYLLDLTTSYYTDEIMKWFKSKVEFKSNSWW